MAKTCGQSFVKYNGDAVRLSRRIPKTVDTVWIGVKKHPEKMRTITTFKDKEGNIIERVFDFADGFVRNRIYQKEVNTIDSDEKVNSTLVKDFKIKKRMLPAYFNIFEDFGDENVPRTVLWTPIKYIANHIAKKKNGETIHSQVSITNMEKPTKEIHTFKEFPHIVNGKIQKSKEKLLQYCVNSLFYIVKPFDRAAKGLKFPKNDSFLAYRALDINDAIEPVTRKFVNERGLKRADIRIFPEYVPKDEDEKLYGAHFDPDKGTINFNIMHRPPSKTRLAGTAAHEAEHGWQYFLKSLIGEAVSDWEYEMYEKFGPTYDENLVKEAKQYDKFITDYVPLTKELKDSGNMNKYRESKLEKSANKAGAKARAKYDREGTPIRDAFPHIPAKFI